MRADLFDAGVTPTAHAALPGAVGLSGVDGVAQVSQAVQAAARAVAAPPTLGVVSVGMAGYQAAADRREELARRLQGLFPGARIVLASDMTTTHAGAFDGEPGVVIAAGTGAVALAVDAHGHVAYRDGWGYLLGDDGSGWSIGRAGLRAALAYAESRGGSARLAELAREQFGAAQSLPALVHSSEQPAQLVASFAPQVCSAAAERDPVSQAIVDDAGKALVASGLAARDALDPDLPLALSGGLRAAGPLHEAFDRHLAKAAGGARSVDPHGDALAGAYRLARGIPAHLNDLVTVRDPESGPGATAQGDLGQLATEQARTDLADLDERATAAIITELWRAEATVPQALLAVADDMAGLIDAIVPRMRRGGRLLYVGAGTPGRLAFVDSSEVPPTYGTDPSLVTAIMAGGTVAVNRASEGAEDDAVAGDRDIEAADVGPDDTVIGITASGRTPYVIAAVCRARARGALTVGIANNRHSELSPHVDHPVEILTGPEVISGSTRLKAGTAQKLALNAISTTVMIRLGKTYGPYMVDMRASNDKLRERAIRMVRKVTSCERAVAARALEACGWRTKVAIVMVSRDVDAATADAALTAAGGFVRVALEELR